MKTLKFLLSFFTHIERRQTTIEDKFEELADGVTGDIVDIYAQLEVLKALIEGQQEITQRTLARLDAMK